MQRTMNELLKECRAKAAGNERAQCELQRILDNIDKLPEYQRPAELLPMDDLEARLLCIKELEEHWQRRFEQLSRAKGGFKRYRDFNDAEVSCLLQMDLGFLRNYILISPRSMDYFMETILHFPLMLKLFATKPLSTTDLSTADLSTADLPIAGPAPPGPEIEISPPSESSASGEDEAQEEATERRRGTKFDSSGQANRNQYYLEKRKKLDNYQCVITGTRDPHICHIIPFAANATEMGRHRWRHVMHSSLYLFTQDRPNDENCIIRDRLLSLFTSKQGVSDRHWNLISLSPDIHNWWRRGYCGFKYLGTHAVNEQNPDAVIELRIQFHWMPWRPREFSSKNLIPLGRTKESITAAFSGAASYLGNRKERQGEPIVAISRPETGFNLETGDIFTVSIQRRHMEKMIEAFQVQWALIKMLAMAGGAEAVQDFPDHPDFLDEDWRLPGVSDGFAEAAEGGHEG